MTDTINGFDVETTIRVKDEIPTPHVRVSRDGRLVLETDLPELFGMNRMGKVLAVAAKRAYEELDSYWHLEHERARALKSLHL